MKENQRFEVLDSFRGLCAISVVLYHLHVVDSFAELDFFRGSSVFVEFFFVLSGFVLAHGYAFRDNLRFTPFVTARFFRLFPLHAFMLSVFILLEFGKWYLTDSTGLQLNNKAFTHDYALEEILPNLLMIHAWTPYTNPLSFNTPSWSISIEFYMYLLLFLSLLLLNRTRVIVWAAIPLCMFYLMAVESSLFVSPVMRGLSGFFGGVFCYIIYRRYAHAFIDIPKPVATAIEISLLALVVVVVSSEFTHRTIVATCLFFATVFWFALERGAVSTFFKYKPFQISGRLSYSIYMTHAAVIYVLTSIFLLFQKMTGKLVLHSIDGVRFFDTGYVVVNQLFVICVLSLVIICSCFTYRHIELGGQAIGRSLLKNRVANPQPI